MKKKCVWCEKRPITVDKDMGDDVNICKECLSEQLEKIHWDKKKIQQYV